MKRTSTIRAFVLWAILYGTTEFSFADPARNPALVCQGIKTCEKCLTEAKIGVGCVFVSLDIGTSTPWTGRLPISLMIHSSDDSPSLSTPSQLKLVFGYSYKGIKGGTTKSGVPEIVTFVQPEGYELAFHFSDGSSLGVPEPNTFGKSEARVQMVDLEGWSTDTLPAYYDLYPGDGSVWRYRASGAQDRGALVSYTDSNGRVLTEEDLGIEVLRDELGNLRQVKTPSRLADIITISDSSYEVTVYPFDNDPEFISSTGVYDSPEHEPVYHLHVERPDQSQLSIALAKGREEPRWFRFIPSNGDWTLIKPDGTVETQELYYSDDESTALRIHSYRDESGTVLAKTTYAYKNAYWGYLMTNMIEGVDASDLQQTTWKYYETGNQTDLVREECDPSGARSVFEYDNDFRVTRVANPDSGEAVEYSYIPIDPIDKVLISDSRPRCVVKKFDGIEIERTYYVYGTNGTEIVERGWCQGAPYGAPNSLRTKIVRYPVAGSYTDGLVKSICYENGRTDVYSYGITNGFWIQTIVHFSSNQAYPIPLETVRDIVVFDRRSNLVERRTELFTSGVPNLSIPAEWTTISLNRDTFDVVGHPIRSEDITGRVWTFEWGGNCCGKTSETSSEGVTTLYSYDDAGRITVKTQLQPTPIETHYGYDLLGRLVSISVTNALEEIGVPQTEIRYDSVGRETGRNDQFGNWITTEYSDSGNTVTTRFPSGAISEEKKIHGRFVSRMGRGTPPRFCRYGVDADGNSWQILYKGTNDLAPRWNKTTRNMLGQTIKEEIPSFGGGVDCTVFEYNSEGLISKESRLVFSNGVAHAVQADNLFFYNGFGVMTNSTVDLNGNGASDLLGSDPIRIFKTEFVVMNGEIWKKNTERWLVHPGLGDGEEISCNMVKLTGNERGGSENWTIFASGVCEKRIVRTDREAGIRIEETWFGAGQKPKVRVFKYGLLAQEINSLGTTNTVLRDGLNRNTGFIDSAGHVLRKQYSHSGLLLWEDNENGSRSYYEYDGLGRQIGESKTAGLWHHYEYDAANNLVKEYGSSYAAVYAYDDENRRIALGTTRNLSVSPEQLSLDNPDVVDITQWIYDPSTEKLTEKVFPDGTGPKFVYGQNGKLAQRIWARGITTDYLYDAAGNLSEIKYSDATPDVQFLYDRMGRKIQSSAGSTTNTFEYLHGSSLVVTEKQSDIVLHRDYDDNARVSCLDCDGYYHTEFLYESNGGSVVASNLFDKCRFEFNEKNRLTRQFYPDLSIEFLYDDRTEFLNAVVARLNSGSLVFSDAFEFSADGLMTNSYRQFPDEIWTTKRFDYNERRELTSETLVSSSEGESIFQWMYDANGNRTWANKNGEIHEYVANGNGQYDQISTAGNVFHPAFDADGNQTLVETDTGIWWVFYDAENRPTSFSNSTVVVDFSYDSLGHRIVQRKSDGTTKRMVYDGNELISIIESGVTNGIFWIPEVDSPHRIWSFVVGNESYRPIYDESHNLTRLVDEFGQSQHERTITAFGECLVQTGLDTPVSFSSELYVPEVGCYFYAYRVYNPRDGRWISRDPLREELLENENRYVFVNNSPVMHCDKLGLITFNNCDPEKKAKLENAFNAICWNWKQSSLKGPMKKCLNCTLTHLNEKNFENSLGTWCGNNPGSFTIHCGGNRNSNRVSETNPCDENECGFVCVAAGTVTPTATKCAYLTKGEPYICPKTFDGHCEYTCTLFHELVHASGNHDEKSTLATETCLPECQRPSVTQPD